MNDHIVLDNHFHLNYKNDFLSAAKLYEKMGGTAINLTVLPEHISEIDHYRSLYDKTVRMADSVRANTKLDVIVTLGPYPVDILQWSEKPKDPVIMMKNGLDLAGNMIQDGVANAIGEVGRLHFQVDNSVTQKLNDVLEYAMQKARDMKCPIILHTEDLDEIAISEIETMARKVGIKPDKVIKHHALIENLKFDSGLIYSIPASRRNVKRGMEQDKPFFLETDYIDDPVDKNRYLPADSVPRRYFTIMQEFRDEKDHLINQIFRTLPERTYGSDSFKNR